MNIHDQDIYYKAKHEGIAQGEYQAKVETAKNLLAMNLSIENIAKATGLDINSIKDLTKSII